MKALLPILCAVGASYGVTLQAMKLDFASSGSLPHTTKPNIKQHEEGHRHPDTSMPWPILKPVRDLDPEMLEGRWYGAMSNLLSFAMMEGPARCLTKDFFPAENRKSLQVMATAEIIAPDTGNMAKRHMAGRFVLPYFDGRIHASMGLFTARRYPDESNFMVIKVGKGKRHLESNRELDYVIVTDPTANKLFVLVRDMDHFMDNDMDEVMEYLEETGFTNVWNKPIMVNHTACNYTDPMPPTVPSEIYEEPKMHGRWFQMMGNFFVGHFAPFEDKAKCVTVDLMPGKHEGTLQILGSKTDIETGELMTEEGMLLQDPESSEVSPGIYKYAPSTSPGSNYWVLAVGPLEGKQFEWAIMSDPLSLSLWVLGRDVSTFNNKYKTDVLNILKERNFEDWWNKPVFINHSGCKYPEEPKPNAAHRMWGL